MRKRLLCIISSICLATSFGMLECYASDSIKVGVVAVGSYKTKGNCKQPDRASVHLGTIFLRTMTNTRGFNTTPATQVFFHTDNYAWEKTLIYGNHHNDGGNLYATVDDVDLALYCGHGFMAGSHGIPNNHMHFYTKNRSDMLHASGEAGEADPESNLTTTECYWGRGSDTKWVVAYTCNFLNPADTEREKMMHGVHMVLGYASTMYIDRAVAFDFGDRLRYGEKFIDAFVASSYQYMLPNCDSELVVSALTSIDSVNDTICDYSAKPTPYVSGGSYLQFDYRFK